MIIFSGMRPTGKLHLGHLLGALNNWHRLQEEGNQCFYFVADLHALTTNFAETSDLRAHSQEMVLDWLSVGLDPEKSIIFEQSEVPQHTELFTYFAMITPVGWLERNPTFKELKQELGQQETAQLGFLAYPVMQAADICLYKGEGVPVGQDQVPHLELTREIVRRFNSVYGDIFPEPKAVLTSSPKINGLDGRKMSKSYNNAIFISDPELEIQKKLRSMVTDPKRMKRTDPGNPDDCNLFPLHKVFSDKNTTDEVVEGCTSAKIGCVDCKALLLPNILKVLQPIQDKRETYSQRKNEVRDILQAGNEKARTQANKTMLEVKQKVLPLVN